MADDANINPNSPSRGAAGSALPCPFCGGQTKYVDGGYPLQKGEWQPWWLVQCADDSCGIWASGKTKEAALEKWNRRTTPNKKGQARRETL